VRFIDAQFEGEPYGIIEHIGHCAMDFDTYLKEQILLKRQVVPVFLCSGRKPANAALLTHWAKYIHLIQNPFLEWLLRPLMAYPALVDSTAGYTAVGRGAARIYEVQGQWKDRAPLLRLSDAEVKRGEAELRKLGVPTGSWFVCVHSREGGYIPGSEWQHSFRNSNIAHYTEAMRAIVARGGWCIRVGDPTMRALEPMPGVIDYAVSPSKSDWMDVFLCAHCRFFLGNTSGVYGLASIFGKPSALANMTPTGCAYSPFPGDISIFKLVMDTQNKVMPLPEALADEASRFRYSSEFTERGLKLVDNTPEEIAEMAIEVIDRLDGCLQEDPHDDLQARFLALIKPHHHAWRAPSRIGRAFLKRHRGLLYDDGNVDKKEIEKSG
jgi:putative glycosyltransferase (TIGR04372 family)